MKIYLFLLYLISLPILLRGQTTEPLVPEYLYLHHDKPFYTAGEQIWYKLYFLRTSSSSKVAYLELVKPDGTVGVQHTLGIESGTASGDIYIPLDWPEGYYALRVYTSALLNFDDRYIFTKHLAIYNEFSSDREEPAQPAYQSRVNAMVPAAQDDNLSIQSKQSTYSRRSPITLNFQTNSRLPANLSISVRQLDLLPEAEGVPSILAYATELAQLPTAPQRDQYPVETAFRLSGILTNADNQQTVLTNFLSVHPVEGSQFLRARTDRNGRFEVNLPGFYQEQVIQFKNLDPYQKITPKIDLERPTPPTLAPPPNSELSRTLEVVHYLNLSRQRRRYNELFAKAAPTFTAQKDLTPLRFTADKAYETADYQGLKDVGEFIDEVILTARILRDEDQRSVRLLNDDSKLKFTGAPWYLVDGYLTQDEQTVLSLLISDIERIEIFHTAASITSQFDPVMIRNGVIAIYTIRQTPPASIRQAAGNLRISGFHLPQDFPASLPANDRIPEFRPLIYWNAQVAAGTDGQGKLTFMSTDAVGRYLIEIVGMDAEGAPVLGKHVITVAQE